MLRRTLCLLLVFAGVALSPAASPESSSIAGKKPNILFILVDDQGYGDLSCTGNPILKTPNMDRLHNEGVRFLDFHVSPTCSPTRSVLNTGRHEFRNGVTHTILERERLALDSTTIAQALKSVGYTTGIFGKWHLGDEDAYLPGRRGFDEVFIHGGGGIGQTYPGSCGDAPDNSYFNPAILHNGVFEKTTGYCTDVFFAQTLQWIDKVRHGSQPFYAYLATNAPHAPLDVRAEDFARYQGKTDDVNAAKFFGMLANIDDNIGKLLAKLDEWDLTRNTLVIYMNDNGGTAGCKVYNAGMRGTKGTPFLGGTHAVSFWRWPGTLTPADVPALTAHLDYFPTIAEIAGVPIEEKLRRQVEGRSLAPLLVNSHADWPERTLFTHVGRWPKGQPPEFGKYSGCSIRTPRWHLVSTAPMGAAEPRWTLFDLNADHGEKTNLAAAHADVVADLSRQYEDWWASVRPMMVNEDAVGPSVNPFKERYWKQFGGGPSPELRRRMDPKLSRE